MRPQKHYRDVSELTEDELALCRSRDTGNVYLVASIVGIHWKTVKGLRALTPYKPKQRTTERLYDEEVWFIRQHHTLFTTKKLGELARRPPPIIRDIILGRSYKGVDGDNINKAIYRQIESAWLPQRDA